MDNVQYSNINALQYVYNCMTLCQSWQYGSLPHWVAESDLLSDKIRHILHKLIMVKLT